MNKRYPPKNYFFSHEEPRQGVTRLKFPVAYSYENNYKTLEIDQRNKKVKKTSTEPNVESERAVRRKRLTPGSDLQATPLPVALQGHEAVQRKHPHVSRRRHRICQEITSEFRAGGGGRGLSTPAEAGWKLSQTLRGLWAVWDGPGQGMFSSFEN
jgi:hypothetical protein